MISNDHWSKEVTCLSLDTTGGAIKITFIWEYLQVWWLSFSNLMQCPKVSKKNQVPCFQVL